VSGYQRTAGEAARSAVRRPRLQACRTTPKHMQPDRAGRGDKRIGQGQSISSKSSDHGAECWCSDRATSQDSYAATRLILPSYHVMLNEYHHRPPVGRGAPTPDLLRVGAGGSLPAFLAALNSSAVIVLTALLSKSTLPPLSGTCCW
jgi:hypothetical protein